MKAKSKINMNVITLVVAIVALLIGGGAYLRIMINADVEKPAAAEEQEEESVAKVVWHADFADPRRFSAMLTSINNMVTTYQNNLQDYDVRIVFVSYGIRFVTEDKLIGTPFEEDKEFRQRRKELQDRLFSLRDVQGVKLELCGITREAINLPEEKLVPGVTIVRSGVVRIQELQDQGFAYIKVE